MSLSFCSVSTSNLAQNFREKLRTGPKKFDINSVQEFYWPLNLEKNPFDFKKIEN